MAISGSIYAQQDAEYIGFDTSNLSVTNGGEWKSEPIDGVTVSAYVWDKTINLYDGWDVVIASTDRDIAKVVFEAQGDRIIFSPNVGSLSLSDLTWTGSEKKIVFSTKSDISITNIKVYLAEEVPDASIAYTVNVTGAPEGAAVTLDGVTMTGGGTHTVVKFLTLEDLKVTAPDGYYAETSYDEANHAFTVIFKTYYIYTVHLTLPDDGQKEAALLYADSTYHDGDQILAKTPISDDEAVLNDLNGYEESVLIQGNDITAIYTRKADIDYTITLVKKPVGASVSVNGTTFRGNGTLRTHYTLGKDDVTANAPAGYGYTVSYDTAAHAFTVTFGMKDYVEYDIFTVEYTFNKETQTNEYKETKDLVTVSGKPYERKLELAWDFPPVVISSERLKIKKIVFNWGERTINAEADCGTYNSKKATWEGSAYTVSFTTPNPNVYQITHIDIYLEPAEPTTYTFAFEGAPEGATVTIDGETFGHTDTYTIEGTLAVADIDAAIDDYNTTVTIEEGNVVKVVYSRNAYTVVLTGDVPEGATILIDGTPYTDGATYHTTESSLITVTIDATCAGYETEVVVSEDAIIVTYLAESTMGKTFTIADISLSDGKYWTTFCYDRDFMLPAGYTAYAVAAAAENGALTIAAIKGKEIEDGSDYYVQMATDNYTIVSQDAELSGTHIYILNGGHTTLTATESSYHDLLFNKTSAFTCATTTGNNITKVNVTYLDGESEEHLVAYTDINAPTYAFSIPDEYNGVYTIEICYEGGESQPVIPAGEGILICADAPTAETIAITPVKRSTPAAIADNLLVGCTTANAGTWSETDKKYYKFTVNDAGDAGSAGFYWAVDGGESITTKAGKAYLVLDSDLARKIRSLRLDGTADDTTDGIGSTVGLDESTPLYNLGGQHMSGQLPAGIYVKGDKKFITK